MYGGLETELAKARYDDRVELRQMKNHRRHLAVSGMKKFSMERIQNLYKAIDREVNPSTDASAIIQEYQKKMKE